MADVSLPWLREITASWGLSLSDQQYDQFVLYAQALQQWNRQINLTRIDELATISVRHFLDSLVCVRFWGDTPDALIDVGSGAGLPGLPLKIAFPHVQLTLLESVGKKARFLEHIVDLLGLHHVVVAPIRAETAGQMTAHREQYAVATARAVAHLRVLAEYCLPLVTTGGRVLAPKGALPETELAEAQTAIHRLGGQLLAVEPVQLPGLAQRTLVVLKKTGATPADYPRRPGVPDRRPL